MFIARQGDVLIMQVETLPQKMSAVDNNGRIVLAEGEATGHAHCILATACEAELFTVADEVDRFLRVRSRSVQLQHEEHGTITLPEGNYRIVRQVEYHPAEIRRVAD